MADTVIIAIDGVSLHATIEPLAWPEKKLKKQLTLLLEPILGKPGNIDKQIIKRNGNE